MTAGLNLRDIGEDRKNALKAEAQARGLSVADIVRECIDQGLARARADRARNEWIRAARAGLLDETRHLEKHGPALARFRRPQTTMP